MDKNAANKSKATPVQEEKKIAAAKKTSGVNNSA